VENAVAALLPHGLAQAEAVAGELGMSPRTLARRLAAEEVAFSTIVRELRIALAQRHLADGDLSVSQIAWLLGYREVGAFTHAFRRWTGMTPSEARVQSAASVA
jgi:AraC-like DNA-binding protein